ncbi:hypothetical protein SAMN02745752_00745 [Marinospirillum alkaliphilum DSM 21637]|uniref:DUF2933 domain-containing protein n=1 Tax=Marinospirillum alkaliphilum DSM 21637 TaxID=1122209 RepID=A0A1K1V3J0_9GAMM|nr:hypothetical protein SAMN02745752_00745 [Marinospirillum alkaliphilum DSM 21637]
MKHQSTGMLFICLLMLGAGLFWVSLDDRSGLWLLLLMPACMVVHLLLHRKGRPEHKKPPE